MSYTKSDDITQLAEALAVAQGAIENAAKDSANPFFKSSYADLASIWDAIRCPISANGLAIMQLPSADGPRVTITTVLTHKSGQWISSDLTMTAKDETPQGIGSAITYARRYALQSVAGVAPEDDDGNGASGRGHAPQQRKEQYRSNAPSATPQPVPDRKPAPVKVDTSTETLRKSIDETVDKLRLRYEATDAMKEFWRIMGAHGFDHSSQIPADYAKAKGVIDELKATLKELVPA
jgi:hypothetical protein